MSENVDVFLFKVYMDGKQNVPLSIRNRWVSASARNFVRMYISQLTGRSHDSLIFSAGSHGKPYIEDCDLHFNLSHCGNMVLAAFSAHEVGADIEVICRSGQSVVQRIFTQGEKDYIAVAPSEKEAQRRFCEIWTAKEAYLKLGGVGLSGDMNFDTADRDGLFKRIMPLQSSGADIFSRRVNIELNENDFIPKRGEYYAGNGAEFQLSVCAENLGEVTLQILD